MGNVFGWGNTPPGSSGGGGGSNLQALENKVNNLSQIAAKTNITNTFTQNQNFEGWLVSQNGLYNGNGSSITIGKIKNQGEKNLNFIWEQNTAGFRNYCNFNLKHKYSNQNDSQATTLFQIQTRDTGQGIYVSAEANKIQFQQPTTIDNVGAPTQPHMAATKSYVDTQVNTRATTEYVDNKSRYVKVVEDTNSISPNVTKSYTMSQNIIQGVNKFVVTFALSGVDVSFEWNVYANSTSYTNMSNVFKITDSTGDLTPSMDIIFWISNNNRFNLRTGSSGFSLTNGIRVYLNNH